MLENITTKAERRKKKPMVQFHLLSSKFDEEKKLKPLQNDNVRDIKRKYEKQLL